MSVNTNGAIRFRNLINICSRYFTDCDKDDDLDEDYLEDMGKFISRRFKSPHDNCFEFTVFKYNDIVWVRIYIYENVDKYDPKCQMYTSFSKCLDLFPPADQEFILFNLDALK